MRYRLKVSRDRAVEFRKEMEASVKNEEKVVEEVNHEIKRNNLLVDELTKQDKEIAELKRQMKVIEDKLRLQIKNSNDTKRDYSELYLQYQEVYDKLHPTELDRNAAKDGWQSLIDKWEASKDLFTECSNLLQLIQKDIDGPDKDELSDVENKNENSTANKQLKKEWKVQTRLEQFFAKNKAKALELGVIEPREQQESQPGEFSLLPYMDLCSSVLKGHPVDERM